MTPGTFLSLLALAVSSAALIATIVNAYSGHINWRSSRNANDPFVICEYYSRNVAGRTIGILTIRNKGGSTARNIRVSLSSGDNDNRKPYWISPVLPYLEKDGYKDLWFPIANSWCPNDYSGKSKEFFGDSSCFIEFSSNHIDGLSTKYPLRLNTSPSEVMLAMLNEELRLLHGKIIEDKDSPFKPWTKEDVLVAEFDMVEPPIPYEIANGKNDPDGLLDLILPPTQRT